MFIKMFIDRFNPDNVIICSDHGMKRIELKAAENQGIVSGKHSEDPILIMWGKDIKEKGELKDWNLINIYNKILEVHK